ncbi:MULTISPECIES: hypothetical protein [Rhodobacterales]|uniref:hypothetical protein n=1 Tax=Rhodobacterales TaxID=204455 RepID=UPI0015933D53|nr:MULTISPECIES: hypothetical protein [Rhodobacterales]MCD9147196.1 hypothetical protein [Pseudophaeobacter flagellatus]
MTRASEGLAGWPTVADLRQDDSHPVFRSRKSAVSSSGSVDVSVDVKLDANDIDLSDTLRKLQSIIDQQGGPALDAETVRASLQQALETTLQKGFARELDRIVAAYRDMLERRMASGQDEAISRALTRAKLQTEVLSSVPMVDQSQACLLLGLSDTNPSATLKRYESKDRILRFDLRGKAAYPLFQFDVAERRIHPMLLTIMKLRSDDWGGKMALLHWLTRPNRSLGGAKPCAMLAEDADGVLKSFTAEIAEPLN